MALKFRRGTTAQKSGSLAFGEPYVNTTLGALQIGLESSDITIRSVDSSSAIVVTSVSASSFVSASSLKVTGNASIDGNLSLGGNITIGDASSDTLNVVANLSSSLIPQTTNAFDLGSSDKIWRDLYISTGSIKFVDGTSVVNTFSSNTLTTLLQSTGSVDGRLTEIGIVTGSLISSASAAKTKNDSQDISIDNLNTFSGSQSTKNGDLATYTGSLENRFIQIAVVSGSLISSASNHEQRLDAMESVSGSWVTENETSSFARTNTSNTFEGNQAVTGNLVVTGSISANEFYVTYVTSSVMYNSGSNRFGDSADDLQQLIGTVEITGSIKGAQFNNLATITGSLITTASNHEQRLDTIELVSASYATTGSNSFVGTQYITGGVMIGEGTFHSPNPEKLHVGNTGSINVAHFEGRHNNYAQINLTNTSSGSSASGDIVVTADNGTENIHFVDLGINSSTYNAGYVGYENDAYLINVGNDLYLGTVGGILHPSNLNLFAQNNWESPQIVVSGSTQVGFNTSEVSEGFQYEFSGSIKANHNLVVEGTISSSTGFSGSINGIGDVTNYSTSVDSRITNLSGSTYSVSSSLDTRITNVSSSLYDLSGSTYSVSSSLDTRITNISSSVYDLSGSTYVVSASLDTRITNLSGSTYSVSSSFENRFTEIAVVSGSLISSASNHEQRLDAIETESGSYARINSTNIFTATQTITGSMYISGDLVVQGTSSVQNISASAVSIGTNIINLNTATPAVRFAGLRVIDSGSTAMSSSLLWDSVNNHWIYQRESGAVYGGGMLISGPRNLGTLGDEVGMTNNRLVMGNGGDHISSSGMWTDGNSLSIPIDLEVTGSIIASAITASVAGNATTATTLQTSRTINGTIFDGSQNITIPNLVSGSSQITLADVTGYSTLAAMFEPISSVTRQIVSGSSQIIPLLPAGTVSGSTQVLGGTGIVSSSSQITYGNIAAIPSGIVSGSSQIDATATTNWATGIKTQLNTNTVISGSSQVSGITNAQLVNSTISGKALGTNLDTLTIGTGLSGTSYNGSTGVTITNTGVLSVTTNTGLSTNVSTSGDVTITNTGVRSIAAGTGVSVSSTTGDNCSISIGQAVATSSSPTFAGLTINGAITATGDITAYYSSDKRYKNNIQPITNALAKVRALNGVTWEWNDDVSDVTKAAPKTGLIAQEVQSVLPEVVKEKEDGYLGLDYAKMMGLMVEAIKEQQIQIDNLTLKVAELEKQKGL